MDLRPLRLFLAVVEELNFRRAAEREHITQPALSRAIQRLERQLGTPLFERDKTHVAPTSAGATLYADLLPVMQRLDAVLASARTAAPPETLTLGYISPALYGTLPLALTALCQERPGAQVKLTELASPDLVRALMHRELDAAVLGRHALPDALRFAPTQCVRYVLALPGSHRLAALPTVPLAALSGEALISPRAREPLHARFVQVLAEHGAQVRVQDVFGLDTVLNFVAAGLGVAFIPESVRARNGAGLIYRAVTPELPPLELGVATRREQAPLLLERFVAHAVRTGRPSAAERR